MGRWLLGFIALATALARAQTQSPARLPTFETVSVKPSTGPTGENGQPGGRYTATRTVRFFIADAFFFATPQAMSRVIGGPAWIDSDRYEINAKGTWQPTPTGPPRELFLMIRSMLEDRFQLKTHYETRELPIYELVLARADGRLGAGLHKSDVDCDAVFAARRGGAPPPPRRGPMDPPPCNLMGGPARIISGGVPIEQLAVNLGNRVERLVIDKTGLAGRFEFNFAFTPDRIPDGAPPPGVPPVDPNGPGIFTALQEQLGLKLVPAKAVLDVVVIDSVERPTAD
jgi:bla regulator protein blaR1